MLHGNSLSDTRMPFIYLPYAILLIYVIIPIDKIILVYLILLTFNDKKVHSFPVSSQFC